jgi:hypothetical protein
VFRRRLLAAAGAATGFVLVSAPAAMAQAENAMEDHSRDAQLIAGAILVGITIVLASTGRGRRVAKQKTEWTDFDGEKHTANKGWVVPPGADVPEQHVATKQLSAFRSLYLGKDNRASTSKAVALAWTYAVVYGLLSLLAAKLLGSDGPWQTQIDNGLQQAYLLLLGGPYAAAVIAKYTAVATEGAANKTIAPEASPAKDARNLIADDDGDTDLGDFQYVLFNLVALAFFFGNFVPHLSNGFPDLPDLLVGLALTSATGYAAKKAAVNAAGPQLTGLFPETVATTETVEVWGRSLVHNGAAPRVSIGGVACPKVEVIATGGAADRLKVTIHASLAGKGDQPLRVTTAAGARALTPGGSDHLTVTIT